MKMRLFYIAVVLYFIYLGMGAVNNALANYAAYIQ